MHLRKLALLAGLAAAGAFAACTLNPQPLPPSDDNSSFGAGDASTRTDSGSFSNDPETPGPIQDGGAPVPNDGEGGAGGDGGDAGSDGGDAGSDADADAG